MNFDEVYKIGRLGKPHGVKGELQMQFDDDVFDRTDAEYLFLNIDGILVPFFMEEYRFRSDSVVLMKFCDIDDADSARELTGCDVYFPRSHGDDTADVTWAEIIGYKLADAEDGKIVGIIESVDDSTINTLFNVMGEDGNEHFIPANGDLIKHIDRDSKTITMELPNGLFDL